MAELTVFYNETFQQIKINNFHRPITIGNDVDHTVTIQSVYMPEVVELMPEREGEFFNICIGEKSVGVLKDNLPFSLPISEDNEITILFTKKKSIEKLYYIGSHYQIRFGEREETDHIIKNSEIMMPKFAKSFLLLKKTDGWYVEPENPNHPIFINGERVNNLRLIQNGDIIFWRMLKISLVEGDVLSISTAFCYKSNLPEAALPVSEMKRKYPNYRRTPRMIYELPEEKVNLSYPYQPRDSNQRGLFFIIFPPLIMLIVMGAIAIIQPRGLFMIISVAMFLTTIITSTTQYFREKSNRKKENEKRIRLYTAYLERKREELGKLKEQQRFVLSYHFPSFERLKYLTSYISERIWERTIESADFLSIRIGRANVPSSYEVAVGSEDQGNREMDELAEDFEQMVKVYKEVENVPLTVDLSYGSVGFIGKHSIVSVEIEQIIGQIAFFHSYHDVRIVAIVNEEDYANWGWMRWLPHFQIPQMFARGFIYNEQTRDQLLSTIYEIVRERELDEDKKKKRFLPHFLFIVTNRNLISEHMMLEYLEGNYTNLGISAIFVADSKENLSENIHTLVRYINEDEGDILIQDKKAVNTPFQLDQHERGTNETFARTLYSLNHQLGMNNSIPTKVTFMELFGVKEPEELKIWEKWNTNLSSKSLAVPIGLKGKDEYVELNLHEKAHGPHGLVAGTTGSGKSELLQTYILSLAVHFHPHDVAFLLIDYKGGGMAQPFKNLPHLLGTITNIEGSKNFSMRALASIKSELKRRQRLFDEYEVNHIHDYTELYRKGKAKEPLPHLFLISDEFAELKSEEPEFIRELVSAARIGRSLGIHLILATQKPGGVVDEQIWSNARFRIALKVQDANDSKEILKNSDAANITVTGRAYLQVGNNEVYELFQSAWSGAPFLEDHVSTEDEIAIVTDFGLKPLTAARATPKKRGETITEIEAIVKHIYEISQAMGIKKLRSPWLPPLANRLFVPKDIAINPEKIPIGLMDIPEKQLQTTYYYQPIEDGNIGIIGTSGYGKSMTIQSIVLRMAETFTPEEVHFYIFDFGNGALLPLRQLHHTGDYFRIDDGRKIEKFFGFLKSEMDRRKQLFEEKEASNIKLFNSMSDRKLPLMYIFIDNFDLIRDEYQDMETQFIQISRDGQSLGIYLIIAATRVNAVRQSLMNNLKTKFAHYLLDKGEVYSVMGRVPFEVEPVPGQAIVKKDEAYLLQVYLPAEGKDDIAVLENMRNEIAELKKQHEHYEKPPAIPMLPPKLNLGELMVRLGNERPKSYYYPIGLDEELVAPVFIDFQKNKHALIVGQSQKGKTNAIKVLLESILYTSTESVGLFDGIDRGLSDYASMDRISYLDTKDQILQWAEAVKTELENREVQYMEAVREKRTGEIEFPPIFLIIDSLSRFNQTIDSILQGKLAELVKRFSHLGFTVIVGGSPTDISKGYDPFSSELKQIRNGLLFMKKSDQNLFAFPYDRKEQEIVPGFGYIIVNGNARKIQIPLYEKVPMELLIN